MGVGGDEGKITNRILRQTVTGESDITERKVPYYSHEKTISFQHLTSNTERKGDGVGAMTAIDPGMVK